MLVRIWLNILCVLLVRELVQKAVIFSLGVLILSRGSVAIRNLIRLPRFGWWYGLLHIDRSMLKVYRWILSWDSASLLLGQLYHILKVLDTLFQNLWDILIVAVRSSCSLLVGSILLVLVLGSGNGLVIILHVYSLWLAQIDVLRVATLLMIAAWLSSRGSSSWLLTLAPLSVMWALIGCVWWQLLIVAKEIWIGLTLCSWTRSSSWTSIC